MHRWPGKANTQLMALLASLAPCQVNMRVDQFVKAPYDMQIQALNDQISFLQGVTR